MKKELLDKYAELIVKSGANVQQGQRVRIYASTEQAEFVVLLAEKAYQAGAARVDAEWNNQALSVVKSKYEALEEMAATATWEVEKLKASVEEKACEIHILSDNPDGMRDADTAKLQAARIARKKVAKPYDDALDNEIQWTIAAVPSPAWAQKVFGEADSDENVEKLWDAILATVYVREDNDPIEVWAERDKTFKERCEKLNSLGLEKLHYVSANGTDFTVWLNAQAQWAGGSETTKNGTVFNPNMPTEEIFTSPMAGRAEGVVVATKPLSYQGKLIKDFSVTFNNGRAVSWTAEEGYDELTAIITSDDGAAMLGELALVPWTSPINASGILYYNTLFDENASCHVALGRGFTNLVSGYESMSEEELKACGVNDSLIHVDFMIGAPDLKIYGYTADGNKIAVFDKGNWAI